MHQALDSQTLNMIFAGCMNKRYEKDMNKHESSDILGLSVLPLTYARNLRAEGFSSNHGNVSGATLFLRHLFLSADLGCFFI